MATNSWKLDADGDWAVAANWTAGLPVSSQDVTIATANVRTITHDSGNDTVHSLTVGDDVFGMGGGTLDVLTFASFADTLVQTGGLFIAQTATISGNAQLLGGTMGGNTALTVGGTIEVANYTFAGGTVVANASTMHETGQVTVGDATGVDATINNKTGALYNIAGDFGIGAGAASASFVNAGTLEKSAGVGDSQIGLNLTDTGLINVTKGTIELDGPSNSVTGALAGGGTLAFGGSGITYFDPTQLNVTGLYVGFGATLDLGRTMSYLFAYTQYAGNSNDVLNLGSFDLTLHGSVSFGANFGQADVVGTGTLVLTGTSSLSAMTVGGAVTLANSGTANVTGEVTLGDGSGQAASITNAGTATINLVDGAGIQHGAPSDVTLANVGTIAVTGGGTSAISAELTSTGSLVVTTGQLQLDGTSNALTGSITGTGSLVLTDGTTATFAPGTLTIAAVALGAASVTLGAAESYAGAFSITPGNADGTLSLGGKTLALSGADTFTANFGQSIIDGAGSLALSGTTTIANFVLGGTVAATNTGLVDATGAVEIGDGSGNVASFTNAAAGTFDLTGANAINPGSASGLVFGNAGLLEETGGGSGVLNIALASTGTLDVTQGALQLDATGNSITGTVTGPGALVFTNGATASFAPTTLSIATIALGPATVTLGASETFAGAFNITPGNADAVLALGGNTLALSGVDTFTAGFGQSIIDGAGVLTLSGTATIGNFTLGGTVAATNAGQIIDTGNVTIGDGLGNVATFTNAQTGTYDITAAVGIGTGAHTGLVFNNSGLLEMTGTGLTTFAIDLAQRGTLAIATGAGVALGGGSNVVTGKITGGGTLQLNGGSTTTLMPGASLAAGQLTVGGAATLDVDGNTAFAGALVVPAGNADSVIDLAGKTLTLSGPASFSAGFGQAVVLGSGVLATSGSTSAGETTIGGTVTLDNSGTFTVAGAFTLGDSAQAAAITNSSSGEFDLTGGNGIGNGGSVASTVTNAGLLQNTGTLAATIATNLASTGTLNVGVAAIALTGNAISLAGSVAGTGALALDAGTTTIAAGTKLSVGTLEMGGVATVDVLGALTYAGQFIDSAGAPQTSLNVGANAVTLDGPAQFSGTSSVAAIDGTGTLDLAGLTTASNLLVGAAAELENSESLVASGLITVGDGSGQTASLVNAAGAVLDFVNDFGNIALGLSPASDVVNSGTVEKTGGTGTSSVAPAFINGATVLANTGELEFAGGVTNTGTMTATGAKLFVAAGLSGTGTLAIHASGVVEVGTAAAATQTVQFADAGTGELVLDNASVFAGLLKGLVAGDLIDITSAGATNAAATFAGGVLTVTDGPSNTVVAKLHIAGSYTTSNFTAGNDGHSGILITVH